MLNFLDVCERVLKGPVMSEKDFDMNLFLPRLSETVKKYGIRYGKATPVPSADRAADNLFAAAVDFLSQVGVYCQNTNRIIRFTKEEILAAVKHAPGFCAAGGRGRALRSSA